MPTRLSVADVAVDSLRPHPRNYRTHPDDQLAHIVASIEAHGFYRNVVVARDGTILAGHGVVLAARRLGFEELPVLRLDVDPDSPEALQVLTGDNEIGRLGEVDDRALLDLLRDLAVGDWDRLLGTGFDEARLGALTFVTRPPGEVATFDVDAEWVGLPAFEAATSEPQVVVKFLSDADRDRFVADVLGGAPIWARRIGNSWTTWWPEKPRNDLSAVRFEEADAE